MMGTTTIFKRFARQAIWLGLGSLLLTACSLGASAAATPTATLAVVVETEAPIDIPRRVGLLSTGESDAALTAEVEGIVQTYASQHGLGYMRWETIDPGADGMGLEALVVMAPDPGVADLAAALPETRIVTIGFEAAGANVQPLSLAGLGGTEAAFVAGYAAAMVTQDWRIGTLYSAEQAELADAFVAGVEYFCGSCVPVAPPYTEYPQRAQSSVGDWAAGVDQLISEGVRTIYLTPDLELADIRQNLASRGVLLIGSTVPSAEIASQWLATVGADPMAALREQLPQALAGLPLVGGSGGMGLSDANESYLSGAKQADIQNVIDDLASGYIAIP